MGKHREKHSDNSYEDDKLQMFFDDDMDEEAFFEHFQPKRTRRKSKRSRNARRKIEEYNENRQLMNSLREYYDQTDDLN